MADTKITALTALTAADPANDVIPIVDVSDTSMAASGTTKKISVNNILGASGTATLASATITGDLTVDTSTLKVDSANNRVGIGTASPSNACQIQGTGQATVTPTVIGDQSALSLIDSAGLGNNGGMLVLGASVASGMIGQVAIKSLLSDGTQNGTANLAVFTRGATSDSTLTERYRIAANGIATWSNVGGVAGTAMTLNSTGLGVGRTPVAYKFEVLGNAQVIQSNFLDVAFRISQGASTSGNKGQLLFTDSSGTTAYITGYGSAFGGGLSGALAIGVGASDRLIVDASGNVGIGVAPSAGKGCLQLSSGINFPATQVASSDANTLDDYEEGTWTGTLKGSVSDPTIPVTATGAYTKIGRFVHVTIAYSNVTTTGASGNVTITGLPFSGAATGAGSAITFDMFTTSTTLACWNVGTTIAFYVSGQFIPATHNAGLSRNLNVTFSYYV